MDLRESISIALKEQSIDPSKLIRDMQISDTVMKSKMMDIQQSFQNEARAQRATIETAEHTAEMKDDLKIIIDNQNDYIKILENQNEYIKQVLENLFGSSEDSVIVQKEILKIMQGSKPTDGLLVDKGMDVVIQIVFNAVSLYLKSKSIFIE